MVSMPPPKLKVIQKLYYATSHESGLRIFNDHCWELKPPGLRMVDSIDLAKSECGTDGVILELDVDRHLELKDKGGGVFIYELDVEEEHYYYIEGIKILGVLDSDGNSIL